MSLSASAAGLLARLVRLRLALAVQTMALRCEALAEAFGIVLTRDDGPLLDARGHPTAACVLRAQRGDRGAREIITRGCLPILRQAARHPDPSTQDDLFQEAAIGFMRAIDKWRPDGGASFKTYARQWARAFAGRARKMRGRRDHLEALAHEDESGKLPEHSDDGAGAHAIETAALSASANRRLVGRYVKDAELLKRKASGETLEEIGQSLGLSRERARQLIVEATERISKKLEDVN